MTRIGGATSYAAVLNRKTRQQKFKTTLLWQPKTSIQRFRNSGGNQPY